MDPSGEHRSPVPAPAGEREPFQGSDSGYVVVSETADPRIVLIQAFSTGSATHLGMCSLVAQARVDLEEGVLTEGSFTLTASNGDTIAGTYAGRAAATDQPGVIGFEAEGPITGGTGRYAEALGRLAFVGTADLATGAFTEDVSGTVSFGGG